MKSHSTSIKKSLINDFGISKPRIAVLGFNPHAGEDGLLGKEENDVIIPTIKDFKNKGNLVYGPFPADGSLAVATTKSMMRFSNVS